MFEQLKVFLSCFFEGGYMDTKFLKRVFHSLNTYGEVLEDLKDKKSPLAIYGVPGEAISSISKQLAEDIKRPTMLVTYDARRAVELYEDLCSLHGEGTFYFPEREFFFFNQDAHSHEINKERLQSLQGILNVECPIVITTMEVLQDFFIDPNEYKNLTKTLTLGDQVDLDELVETLIYLGYERVQQVATMGEFSLRGGILDIFTSEELPYRLEFFDIEIDSIRQFDPETQRSIEVLDDMEIAPIQEILLSKPLAETISKGIDKDLQNIDKLDDKAQERAREKFIPIVDKLREGEWLHQTDLVKSYLPMEARYHLLDYFQSQPLVILDEPRRIEEELLNEEESLSLTITGLMEAGELLGSHRQVQWDGDEVFERINREQVVLFSNLLKAHHRFNPQGIVNANMRTVTSFNGRLNHFQEEILSYLDRKYTVMILGGSGEKPKRLIKNLADMGFPVKEYHSDIDVLESGIIYVCEGHLHGGFEITNGKFVLYNSFEIYGRNETKRRKRKKKQTLTIDDLSVGDYVVHEAHGVGRFEGSTQMEVQGVTRDYLNISYQGGDKLFLPMDQLSVIHKYIGNEDRPPKINKLHSTTWKKAKARAKKNVEEMAEDLIKLYAERESMVGYAFSEDTPWQKEFEDAFMYEETPGQLESAEEIKKDMERARPMDRLLCADVGYGKTEVALRAAFKAVMDGKQVAFLVPTTVLAQQHYNTMVERFSSFPINIALLSRFRTKAEQTKDLNGLKKGRVDIIVGTHRLLSKDVEFKDLGLLIVDEEQRFGVRHKEQLKLMKKSVDTLTLTATPIPRTLQMSMIGIRDMSIIEDPPEERFPVQTHVLEYNPMMIREAILKEIGRGGQVYFVYNRVQSMERKLLELQNLVPEAEFAMANGQMSERQLENTMLRFIDHEVDVLLCSTIIEIGMDVSNANTIIIDEANRLGLSQLYQLRGRVGRSNRVAYAYFTYRKDVSISEVAEKRLQAIKELTQLGSGYKIALRDLEIRGSGNILGESQHGHIESIGYELYIKFLRQAVNKLKGEEEEPQVETFMDLQIDAFISNKYIQDEVTRMEIYRKISLIENDEDESDLIDELIDRFGEPPQAVMNLIRIAKLRASASKLQIDSITQQKNGYKYSLNEQFNLDLPLINELTQAFGKRITFATGSTQSFTLTLDKEILKNLEKTNELLKIHKSFTNKTEDLV